jgi:NAD(P)H-hydrate epimerase
MKEVMELPKLPERALDAHKGAFGHAFVLAGSLRMTGAALLTTRAALRSGAGLVTLGMPAAIHPMVAPALLSAMSLPLPSTPAGTFSKDAIQPVMDFAKKATAIGLGPGLTTDADTAVFANRVVQRSPLPLVLDADGLNCMGSVPTSLRTANGPRILTPHPGEAARLSDRRTETIQADRSGVAAELAGKFGCIFVLKGHETVVTDGDRIFVNRTGNPGMATGGSGDVLTGLITGLLAQGLDPFDAAVLGVHVHGLAGDLAAREIGEVSLTARDLIEHLGKAFLTLDG